MAVEVIEVEIEVTTKGGEKLTQTKNLVKTTVGEFENLNEAISKTQDELGKLDPKSDKFKKAAKDLSQLKDRLKETEAQSLRFTEALAQQPGVMGLVGQSLEGLRGTMKLFMANPIIAVVAGIAGAFLLLKDSLSKTERGQQLMSKASETFGKVIGPVMAIIEKVAFPIFETLINLIDKAAGAFSWLAEKLGVGTKEIEEATRNSSEALTKQYEEEQKKREEATKKAQDEAKKNREEAARQLVEDIKKAGEIQLEAELSLLSDKDREIKEREIRFNKELEALKKAGFTDFTALEAEYRKDLQVIEDNYNKESKDKETQRLKDLEQLYKDYTLAIEDFKDETNVEKVNREEQRALEELERLEGTEKEKLKIQEFYALKRKEAQDADDKESSNKTKEDTLASLDFQAYASQVLYDSKRQSNEASYQDELDLFDKLRELQKQRLQAEGATAQQLLVFDKESQTQRTQIAEMQEEERLGVISNALGTAAGLFGEHTAAAKALSISQAIIDTYSGANKALGAYPPPFNFIAAGAVIAGGLANVKKIISTKQPSLPGAKQTSERPAPSFSAPAGIAAPQIQTQTGATPGSQLAQTITSAVQGQKQQPLRAYVVSQDISSNQALDRRTSAAATFGG